MVALYFINSICTVWPSCEPFVTAWLSPLDGPSPSHLGPGSPARIQSGFFHPSQQRKGNPNSVNQSEVPLVQAKAGVQGSWDVAVVKNLGGGGLRLFLYVCVCVGGGGLASSAETWSWHPSWLLWPTGRVGLVQGPSAAVGAGPPGPEAWTRACLCGPQWVWGSGGLGRPPQATSNI